MAGCWISNRQTILNYANSHSVFLMKKYSYMKSTMLRLRQWVSVCLSVSELSNDMDMDGIDGDETAMQDDNICHFSFSCYARVSFPSSFFWVLFEFMDVLILKNEWDFIFLRRRRWKWKDRHQRAISKSSRKTRKVHNGIRLHSEIVTATATKTRDSRRKRLLAKRCDAIQMRGIQMRKKIK